MANQTSYASIGWETRLSTSLGVGATTVNVTSTAGSPNVPCYLTIEPGSDAKREVVLATAKTSTTFTITRAQSGTADVAHDPNVVIASVPVSAHINDLHDRIDTKADTGHAHASTHPDLATHDALGLATQAELDAHAASGHSTTSVASDTLWDAAGDLAVATGPDAAARLAMGAANQVLKVNAAGTGLEYGSASGATVRAKSANESVASSTVHQADDHLTFPVVSGETWVWHGMLFVGTGAEAADISVLFAGPTGTGRWGGTGLAVAATSATNTQLRAESVAIGTNLWFGLDDAGVSTLAVWGYHAATANGSITLQWSQAAASATATTLLQGSFIVAQKVS